MKLLLKKFKSNSSDIRVILEIEKFIKSKWNIFSGERSYNYIVFSDTFSQLLIKLEEGLITTPKEVLNFFASTYRSQFDKLNVRVAKVEGLDQKEIIKRSLINFDNLEPFEYLLFYKYLDDGVLNEKITKILTKIKYSLSIDDDMFLRKLSESNYVTLYLSNELGSKKFLEFNQLINTLGIYYPMVNIPDTELSVQLKEGILNKFLDTINNTNVDQLQKLEKFLFKN